MLIYRLVLLGLLFVPSVSANWVPSGTHSWYNAAVDSTRIHSGGPPSNYRDKDGYWKAIDLNWVTNANDIVNVTNNFKSKIDGINNIVSYEIDHRTIKQRPFGLFAYRRSTKQRIVLDSTPDFSTRSFLDSIVTYMNIFNGVDLQVIIRNDGLAFKWVFHQLARDAFDAWWTSHGAYADVYLVTAFRFDVSSLGKIDLYDNSRKIDTTIEQEISNGITFRSGGNNKFYLRKEYLDQIIWAAPPDDPDSAIQFPIYTRLFRNGGKQYLLEGIKWTDAKQIPAGDISHHDTFGNYNAGTSIGHINNRSRGCSIGSPVSNGTLDSIRILLDASSATTNVRMAICNLADDVPIDSTVEIVTNDGWYAAAVHNGITLSSSTSYELFAWGDASGLMLSGANNASGYTRWTNTSVTYSGNDWANPIPHNNPTSNEQYTIIAVYTISGGSVVKDTLIDTADVQDARIYDYANCTVDVSGEDCKRYNAGGIAYNSAGDKAISSGRRTLLNFPGWDKVVPDSSRLSLYCYSESDSKDRRIFCYPVTRQWYEGTGANFSVGNYPGITNYPDSGVTWNHAYLDVDDGDSVNWTTVGGDYTTAIACTTTVVATGSYYHFDNFNRILNYFDTSGTYYGVILVNERAFPSQSSDKSFYASERGLAWLPPMLILATTSSGGAIDTTNMLHSIYGTGALQGIEGTSKLHGPQ